MSDGCPWSAGERSRPILITCARPEGAWGTGKTEGGLRGRDEGGMMGAGSQRVPQVLLPRAPPPPSPAALPPRGSPWTTLCPSKGCGARLLSAERDPAGPPLSVPSPAPPGAGRSAPEAAGRGRCARLAASGWGRAVPCILPRRPRASPARRSPAEPQPLPCAPGARPRLRLGGLCPGL